MNTNMLTLDSLENLESFVPVIPLDLESREAFQEVYNYISNTITNKVFLENNSFETIINDYNDRYDIFNKVILINELYKLYDDCRSLILLENNDGNYTEEDFEYNGFIKSEFVLHQHNAKNAPLHWDFRFKTEFKTSAYSFVILKHKMPENNEEKLLLKRQPMHPPVWVDMDGTSIGDGGEKTGSVFTIDRGTIYYKQNDESFTFYIDGSIYKGSYHLIRMSNSMYLLFKAKDSIIASKEQRSKEWIKYANNFLIYTDKRLSKIFGDRFYNKDTIQLELGNIIDDYSDISFTNYQYNNSIITKQVNNITKLIVNIPSIEYCINNKDSYLVGDPNSEYTNRSLIHSLEDVLRAVMIKSISFKLLSITQQKIKELYSNITNKNFIDDIYSIVLNMDNYKFGDQSIVNPEDHKFLKILNMFSSIFMGRKYYNRLDFEQYLISYFKKI